MASAAPTAPTPVPPPALRFFVGSYATVPKNAPELEAEFYAGLAALPLCGGLELGLTVNGGLNANHANDEPWLLAVLADLGKAQRWSYVLTTVTSTMGAVEKNPHFGLASDDRDGRLAAIEMGRQACAAVARLNAATGEGACKFVELHSGPPRHTGAATAAGASSSAASLASSLKELLALDWQGAQLVLEHCDWYGGVQPVKGMLSLGDDLQALALANAESPNAKVLLTINWARSVLETRDAATAAAHIEEARSARLLGGFMLSGCSGVEGPYGKWKDSHMPHGPEAGVEHFAEGSLLNSEEIRRCMRGATGASGFAYVGVKITAKHVDGRDVSARVALNGDLLRLAATAAAAVEDDDSAKQICHYGPPRKRMRASEIGVSDKPSAGSSLRVTVRKADGSAMEFEFGARDVVADLKRRLSEIEGIPLDKQRLLRETTELEDDSMLADCCPEGIWLALAKD